MRAATQTAGLLRMRWLLYELVLRDLRLRYRGSVLGVAWTLLNPLLFTMLYTLVFAMFLRMGGHNYPVYVLAGMIPWNWFVVAVTQGTTAILDGRVYVGKSIFPVEVLPLVPVLSNAMNFVISLPLLFVLMGIYHMHFGAGLIALPLVALIQLLLIFGIVMLCATYNVFYRDLQQLISYVLSALFFLTPIFYRADAVTSNFHAWFQWNPLAAIVEAYHAIIYQGQFPDWQSLAYASVIALLLASAGVGAFARHRESFSQYL